MDGKKEGVSVKEIETFARRHRFEVFFSLLFVVSCLFSFLMWGTAWAVVAGAVGAILGVLLSGKVLHFSKVILQFIFKQEKTTQIVLGIVALILAIVIPPLIFLILGLHGGKDIHHWAVEISASLEK
jgi:membrane associated rhomboid family serine protease